MTAIKNYPNEFVERTLLLMEKVYPTAKNNELEVTFIINCLLGLIVATHENKIDTENNFLKKKLFDDEIKEFIPKKIARLNLKPFHKAIKERVNKISLINQQSESVEITEILGVEKYNQVKNLTLTEFIKNIRNGIAHQNLMATSASEHWEGIRIWNHNQDGIKDFEVEFTVSELKQFAIFIGKKFLENNNIYVKND